jgi:hypothetical protein
VRGRWSESTLRFGRGVASARGGDVAAAHALGAALTSHVRFEERELFPACEVELGDALLDEVARRAPKSG